MKYEVAICILTGEIVWIMGPFPCGDWHDVNVFRFALKQMLDEGERVEADDGYVGEDPLTARVPGSMAHYHDDRMLLVRAFVHRRHETVNKRLKQFKCLATVFCHPIALHAQCFQACAVLTQLAIQHGNPLFTVDGYVDPIF